MGVTSSTRRMLARCGAVVTAAFLAASVPPAAGAAPGGPTGPLAPRMEQLLAEHPGGVQVSDNALAWDRGRVVLVMPSPGEAVAPRGLGRNPRGRQVRSMGLADLADPSGTRDVHGCPSGATKKDNYCFYGDRDFGGDRWQFAETCADQAGDWGFSRKTSSWVNTDTDKTIVAYDGNTRLWDEPENSVSKYVGATNNDRLTRWDCRGQ
ncbi:peptidase inhibitor family I36 [Saccharothrix saharensis]|uniref:Peptidase inhibitor family I36 n=1 Tax=Saccharothrix saharensis TaxID=571190 RepID=A0A543JAW6_9PSEU|nr:peptidase inhibitor family I36 protein [Saccharothrix saharensis]TQM79931.1 peptidase inhibitor family I36 [Saccharothrix saharensis]